MRIGLQVPQFRPSTPETMGSWMAEIARTAEEHGIYSMWVMDHFFQLGSWLGPAENPMVEGYTTLGYLAGSTQKIKLGLMVGGVIYRHPSVVIKSVTTLDVLSGGRMYFGIGAAWYEHETVSLGMQFPSMKVRFEQLEDILKLTHQMWRGDTAEFQGKQFTVPYPYLNPQPLSQPHPPILIGGMGKTKTLKYVAQYADACNFFAGRGDEALVEHLAILKQHCQDVGRSFDEIEKTVLSTYNPAEQSLEQLQARLVDLHTMGFSHAVLNINGEYTPDLITALGDQVAVQIADL
ncbi:MAG: TIGR03560 family F420-dependent LLM class oxidoreductase [Anaerolineales bacterium]